ncbi:hypothetical protein Q1M64_28175 [Sinorhizobium meliloti]|nr:hypothetical protein Q1M64_28175 [Sinorhizobium meliloti]
MTNVLGTAGKQETRERAVDARIAVRGDRRAGRQIDTGDDEGRDIECRGRVEQEVARRAIGRAQGRPHFTSREGARNQAGNP